MESFRPFASPSPARRWGMTSPLGQRPAAQPSRLRPCSGGETPAALPGEELRDDDLHHAASWTDEGIRGVKESAPRFDAAKKVLTEMGGVPVALPDHGRLRFGRRYEAPDDAVAARFNLQLGMLGNVRTRR